MAKKEDTSSPYYMLKMRIRSHMPEANASLNSIVAGYQQALKLEGTRMSRADKRRMLAAILSDMADEVLGDKW